MSPPKAGKGNEAGAPGFRLRKDNMSTNTCPNCNAPIVMGAAFCDNCGAPLNAVSPPMENTPDKCPNCGAAVNVGDLYCDVCGHDLPAVSGFPQPAQRPAEAPTSSLRPAAEAPNDALPWPRLLVMPAGNTLLLPPEQDNYVIGRLDPASGSYPDVDLVPFGGEEGGVSRRHAQITRNGDQFVIEDLNSVNYTFVNKQKIPVGSTRALADGDEIRLGRVLMRFKTH